MRVQILLTTATTPRLLFPLTFEKLQIVSQMLETNVISRILCTSTYILVLVK